MCVYIHTHIHICIHIHIYAHIHIYIYMHVHMPAGDAACTCRFKAFCVFYPSFTHAVREECRAEHGVVRASCKPRGLSPHSVVWKPVLQAFSKLSSLCHLDFLLRACSWHQLASRHGVAFGPRLQRKVMPRSARTQRAQPTSCICRACPSLQCF